MTDHHPDFHSPVLFPWRTDFRAYNLPDDPDMTGVGHLLKSAMHGCTPCLEYWATQVAEDEENRLAVVHFLASGYTWAHEKCGYEWEYLTGEGDLFGTTSQKILHPMRAGDIHSMVTTAKGLHPKEVWECIDDALAAATVQPAPVPAHH